jgi:hypothetical protein
MPSPEMRAPEPDSPGAARADTPNLVLVKPAERSRELTALEREFLPPLLEIQETPPSPLQRWVLWSIIALVVALIIRPGATRASRLQAPGRLDRNFQIRGALLHRSARPT